MNALRAFPRFHLLTALVGMLFAAGMLYLNLVPRFSGTLLWDMEDSEGKTASIYPMDYLVIGWPFSAGFAFKGQEINILDYPKQLCLNFIVLVIGLLFTVYLMERLLFKSPASTTSPNQPRTKGEIRKP